MKQKRDYQSGSPFFLRKNRVISYVGRFKNYETSVDRHSHRVGVRLLYKAVWSKKQKLNTTKIQIKIPQKAKVNLAVSIIICNFAP